MSQHEDTIEFYLSSMEGYGLESPRRCTGVRRLRGTRRDDFLLVHAEPPVFHEGAELSEVVLAARHEGFSVLDIREWPMAVHVARFDPTGDVRILDEPEERSRVSGFAWAEIYRTEAEAAARRGWKT